MITLGHACGCFLKGKHIKSNIFEWIINPNKLVINASNFWHGFLKDFPRRNQGLTWKDGFGINVMNSADPILILEKKCTLSPNLLKYLIDYGFTKLVDIQRSIYFRHTKSYWLNAQDLGLNNNWENDWAQYISSLNMPCMRQ